MSRRSIPRLALRPDEAAEAIGVGKSHFYAEILPHLNVVYSGKCRLIPVVEIERWLERESRRSAA